MADTVAARKPPGLQGITRSRQKSIRFRRYFYLENQGEFRTLQQNRPYRFIRPARVFQYAAIVWIAMASYAKADAINLICQNPQTLSTVSIDTAAKSVKFGLSGYEELEYVDKRKQEYVTISDDLIKFGDRGAGAVLYPLDATLDRRTGVLIVKYIRSQCSLVPPKRQF
jgi:hypothetical protein